MNRKLPMVSSRLWLRPERQRSSGSHELLLPCLLWHPTGPCYSISRKQ